MSSSNQARRNLKYDLEHGNNSATALVMKDDLRALLATERELRRELSDARKLLRKAGFTEIVTTYPRRKGKL